MTPTPPYNPLGLAEILIAVLFAGIAGLAMHLVALGLRWLTDQPLSYCLATVFGGLVVVLGLAAVNRWRIP